MSLFCPRCRTMVAAAEMTMNLKNEPREVFVCLACAAIQVLKESVRCPRCDGDGQAGKCVVCNGTGMKP